MDVNEIVLSENQTEINALKIALAAERQRYQAMLNFAPEPYLVTNTVGEIHEANQATATLLNLPRHFLIGKPLASFICESERLRLQNRLSQLCHESGLIQEWEIEIFPCNGVPISVLLRAAAFPDSESNILFLHLYLRDLTPQKKLVYLAKIKENLPAKSIDAKEVIFETDVAGLWVFLNPAWTEITGFSIEESLGTSFLNYLHPGDRQDTLQVLQLLVRRQQDYCRYEVRCLTKEGKCRWVEVFVRLIVDAEGEAIGTSGTLNDITDRKQAETEICKILEQEKELSSLKTRFITMASHEFRTPLATILVASDLLKVFGHKLSEETKLEQLNKIQTQVTYMTQLLEDILFIA